MAENGRSIWEVRLGIHATEAEADATVERIERLLCPDPDHAPPCPVPWSVALVAESALETPELYAPLAEQARIEGTSD